MKGGVFLPTAAIKEALQFAEEGQWRASLVGLSINVDDKDKPIIEATDGHRLHRVQIDNTGLMIVDTEKTVTDTMQGEKQVLTITQHEKDDIIFRLKEMAALSKLHGRKLSQPESVALKITKTRIIFVASGRILVRWIQPDATIPDSLIGFKFGVNIKYLTQALNVFESGDISIAMTDKISPVIFKAVGADHPMHIIMPVRMDG
jgi:DNA polymerase III sliding clamp (beta) subunit (PCNA family)